MFVLLNARCWPKLIPFFSVSADEKPKGGMQEIHIHYTIHIDITLQCKALTQARKTSMTAVLIMHSSSSFYNISFSQRTDVLDTALVLDWGIDCLEVKALVV